ncbi:General transcription and DNA repair factor IIH helicase subunit XPD, partial [Perkinsus olseni]
MFWFGCNLSFVPVQGGSAVSGSEDDSRRRLVFVLVCLHRLQPLLRAGESMGISNLNIDGLRVMFPYDAIYPEQVQYMHYLKQALDASHGQGLIEMPTGTGKTVTIMSLVTSYQLEHPEMGKLVYCTRTVPEMNQAIRELKLVIEYRDRILAGEKPDEPPKRFLGIGLSARRNMCIHPDVAGQADRDKIDIMCREMTSNFIKKSSSSSSSSSSSAGRCSFFEQYDELIGGVGSRYNNDIESSANGQKKKFAIPSGVYTLEDLRVAGGAEGWCPYYMTKRLLRHADVIVFNYQYVLDPRVSASALIAGEASRGAMSHGALAKEGEERPAALAIDSDEEQQFEPAVVIFDEAHNIDDICMDALTVTVDRKTIERATSNVKRLQREVTELKKVDEARLKAEVENLMRGLAPASGMSEEDESIGALKFGPQELKNAVSGVSHLVIPGNVRQAEHFLGILQQVCAFFRAYIRVDKARAEGPLMFLHELESQQYIEARTMKAFDARLRSLMNTLKITDIDEFSPLTKICDLCTLASLHSKGFAVLTDPCPEAEGIYDPQLELSCLDAAIAMRPVVRRYKNVVLTSGTLSPLSMYPKLLGLDRVVVSEALDISLERDCIRPLIVTRSNDIVLSSSFQSRKDEEVSKCYGTLLEELVQVVPDGVVCFFTSKVFMQQVVRVWYDSGTLARLSTHKVVFFETDDVVSTTIALSNYREACDQGRDDGRLPVRYHGSIEYYYVQGLIGKDEEAHAEGMWRSVESLMSEGREFEAFRSAEAMQEYLQSAAGHPFLYDTRQWGDTFNNIYSAAMEKYFARADVAAALHTGGVKWQNGDGTAAPNPVVMNLQKELMKPVLKEVQTVLSAAIPTMIYTGVFDGSSCGHLSVMGALHMLGYEPFETASRELWEGPNHPFGFVQSGGALTFVWVSNSGHMVPTDQPEAALDMMDRFIHNRSLAGKNEVPWRPAADAEKVGNDRLNPNQSWAARFD